MKKYGDLKKKAKMWGFECRGMAGRKMNACVGSYVNVCRPHGSVTSRALTRRRVNVHVHSHKRVFTRTGT